MTPSFDQVSGSLSILVSGEIMKHEEAAFFDGSSLACLPLAY